MLRNIIVQKNLQLLCTVRYCTNTASSTLNDRQTNTYAPILAAEMLQLLKPKAGKTYIDMTFGTGGHSRRILEAAPNIKIIALDRDPNSFEYAEQLAAEYPMQVIPLCGRFSELPPLLAELRIDKDSIDGAIFDLGCSSLQYEDPNRGFSPFVDGQLDMRMEANRFPDELTCADVVAGIDEEGLYPIIKTYGQEKMAKKIARTIVTARYAYRPMTTTFQFADVVASAFQDEYREHLPPDRTLSAVARTFRAMRIFVNNELNEINFGMQIVEHFMKPMGRLVVTTYNKAEDTVVKRIIAGHVVQGAANEMPMKFFSALSEVSGEDLQTITSSKWKSLFSHVIVPSPNEVDKNPYARDAKMRGAIKINRTK